MSTLRLIRCLVRTFLVHIVFVPSIVAQVVDLAKPWTEGALYNKNRAYCTIQANLNRNSRGYVVVQNGQLVAEGYTGSNDRDGQYGAFSSTKSFATMLVGSMVQQGLLSTSETLGDIFDLESEWDGVKQAREKKKVTLEELLTMTSGLVENFNVLAWGVTRYVPTQDTFQQVMNAITYKPSKRGTWQYLGLINIMGQIILRRSDETPGLTPGERAKFVFAEIGIGPNDWFWAINKNEVEETSGGLETNPRDMAKLGQLYLQNGASAPGKQLIPSEWATTSTTDLLDDDQENYLGLLYGGATGYGYQWFAYKDDKGQGIREGMGLAIGAFGQVIAFLPQRNVTIAIMTNECLYCDIIGGVLLGTIVDNLDHLNVAETECTESWFSAMQSRAYYFAKYSLTSLPTTVSYVFSMLAQGRIPVLG